MFDAIFVNIVSYNFPTYKSARNPFTSRKISEGTSLGPQHPLQILRLSAPIRKVNKKLPNFKFYSPEISFSPLYIRQMPSVNAR